MNLMHESNGDIKSSRVIYLTSYMRPELTESAIKKVLLWENLRKLVIIIDGLRATASENERIWRDQTIEVVLRYCEHYSNLEFWLYDTNLGITEHNLRIQIRALETYGAGIWLEEDFGLDFENYSKIIDAQNLDENKSPILISAYSHFNHEDLGDDVVKQNLFLPLWGITFNEEFLELFKKVWHDKSYDPRVVEKMLVPIFPRTSLSEKIYFDKVLTYWTEYLSWGLKNRNRWDAVATYALWTNEVYSLNTAKRYSYDLSYLDPRGMNPRVEPSKVDVHRFNRVEMRDNIFCLDCEIHGSRIPRKINDRIVASMKYRMNRIFR